MATIVAFAPQISSIFGFQATLDGTPYTITVPWNVAGQRWYCGCQQLDGTLVFLLPLIGSPTGIVIEGLSWANGTVTAQTTIPHGYQIGMTIKLAITGCAPDAFNGNALCLITGPDTFSYPLSADPGNATLFGLASYNINIAAGYFTTSTLVFRQSANAFEVEP